MKNTIQHTGGAVKTNLKYTIDFKSQMKTKRGREQRIFTSDLAGKLETYGEKSIKSGWAGLYWKPATMNPEGKKCYQIMFDVDGKKAKNHSDIQENIAYARGFYFELLDRGLTEGMQIILSGKAFRFVWPYVLPAEYSSLFRMFNKHMAGYGAEAGGHDKFMRMLCYRGEKNQCRDKMDVHTQLIDMETFSGLNPEKYQQIVSGQPDFEDYRRALHLITPMPEMPVPEQWLFVLKEYRAYEKAEKAIISIPRPFSSVRIPDAMAELENRGITFREFQSGDTDILKLSECPICSRAGLGWVTKAGYLKCWSANCRANQGIPPREWISGFTDNDSEIPGTPDKTLYKNKEEVWEKTEIFVADAIRSGTDIFINSDPGLGKTTSAIRAAESFTEDKTIIFAMPTKSKAQEEFDRVGGSLITGRTEKNCPQYKACNEIAGKGFRPGVFVCPTCEHEASCVYNSQFKALKKPGIIFTNHSLIQARKAPDKAILVFDEDMSATLTDEISVSMGEMETFFSYFGRWGDYEAIKSIYGKIKDAMGNVLNILQSEKHRRYGVLFSSLPPNIKDAQTIADAAELTEEDFGTLAEWLQIFLQDPGEYLREWEKRLYFGEEIKGKSLWERGTFNIHCLKWLLCLLGAEPGWSTIKITKNSQDAFSFEYQSRLKTGYKNQIIILDGTGKKAVYDKLFDRDFVEFSATVPYKDCDFHWFRKAMGKGKTAELSEQKIGEYIQEVSGKIKGNCLIATHMDVEEKVLKAARDMKPESGFDSVHYLGNRGINTYSDFQTVLCFGTFTLNPLAAWKKAIMTYESTAEQAEHIRHLSNSENLQTIQRIRLINGGKTVIVIGREWIHGLPMPDEVADLRRGFSTSMDEAYHRAEAFFLIHGFVIPVSLAAVGVSSKANPEYVPVKDAYSNSIMRLFGGQKCPLNPYNYRDYITVRGAQLSRFQSHNSGITFSRQDKYFPAILRRLKKSFPGAGEFRFFDESSGRWNAGIGTIEKVRDFACIMGKSLSGEWEQTEPEGTRENDKDDLYGFLSAITELNEIEMSEYETCNATKGESLNALYSGFMESIIIKQRENSHET